MLHKKNKSEKELEIKPQLLTLSLDELSDVVGGGGEPSFGDDWYGGGGLCRWCRPEDSDGNHG